MVDYTENDKYVLNDGTTVVFSYHIIMTHDRI